MTAASEALLFQSSEATLKECVTTGLELCPVRAKFYTRKVIASWIIRSLYP